MTWCATISPTDSKTILTNTVTSGATTVSTTTIKTVSTVVVNWNTCAIDRFTTKGKPLSLPTKKCESHFFGATSKYVLSHNVTQNTTLRSLSLLVSTVFTLSRPSINQKTHTFMDTIYDQIALRTCVKLLGCAYNMKVLLAFLSFQPSTETNVEKKEEV